VRRIEYDAAAQAYRAGRTLPADLLEQWRRVVVEAAPRGGRVLDVGAGTGQFLGPLAEWLDARVVGLEPSAGMREVARAAPHDDRVTLLGGRAEALPLRPDSVDVAWLSAVVHHLEDLDAAVGELRRVVRAGGCVLVRGFFSETPVTGLLAHFPGIERSAATFPASTAVLDACARGGFMRRQVVSVPEAWRFDVGDWLGRAQALRHVDSLLRPLTDDEFAAGLAAVRRLAERGHGTLVSDTTLTLLVLAR
jgi:SAM-dependent methyltransferase